MYPDAVVLGVMAAAGGRVVDPHAVVLGVAVVVDAAASPLDSADNADTDHGMVFDAAPARKMLLV